MPEYARESIEFQPIQVIVDGTPVTDSITLAVLPRSTSGTPTRPTEADWRPAGILDGKPGFMVQGYEPGKLDVWAKVDSIPEHPVRYLGLVYIT